MTVELISSRHALHCSVCGLGHDPATRPGTWSRKWTLRAQSWYRNWRLTVTALTFRYDAIWVCLKCLNVLETLGCDSAVWCLVIYSRKLRTWIYRCTACSEVWLGWPRMSPSNTPSQLHSTEFNVSNPCWGCHYFRYFGFSWVIHPFIFHPNAWIQLYNFRSGNCQNFWSEKFTVQDLTTKHLFEVHSEWQFSHKICEHLCVQGCCKPALKAVPQGDLILVCRRFTQLRNCFNRYNTVYVLNCSPHFSMAKQSENLVLISVNHQACKHF